MPSVLAHCPAAFVKAAAGQRRLCWAGAAHPGPQHLEGRRHWAGERHQGGQSTWGQTTVSDSGWEPGRTEAQAPLAKRAEHGPDSRPAAGQGGRVLRRVGVLTGFHPSRVGSYGSGPPCLKMPPNPWVLSSQHLSPAQGPPGFALTMGIGKKRKGYPILPALGSGG